MKMDLSSKKKKKGKKKKEKKKSIVKAQSTKAREVALLKQQD